MQNFIKLKKCVDAGELQLTFILSLPRTRSTALQLALTQAPEIDGQLNEPFVNFHDFTAGISPSLHYSLTSTPARKVRSFEYEVCKKIADRVESLFASTHKNAVHLIIHDHFSHILQDEIQPLLSLVQNMIVTIRDPHLRFASVITRLIHDKLIADRGAVMNASAIFDMIHKIENTPTDNVVSVLGDVISKKRILQIIKKEPHDLLTGEDVIQVYRATISHIEQDLSVLDDNVTYHLNEISRYRQTHALNFAVVESDVLIKQPRTVLQKVIEKMQGITFSENMINRWQKGTGDDFHCCVTGGINHSNKNAWNGPAIHSSGFTTKNDAVDALPSGEAMPQAIRPLLHAAMENYKRFISMPEFIRP